MSGFNASTSQLKAVKNMIDAWSSFNFGKVNTLVSKNYKYEAFNGVSELATVDNKGRAEMTKAVLSGLTKLDVTYHEVIEAPGRVILHVSALIHTACGATLPYDTLVIISLVEEDGELKIGGIKDFPDPQKRNAFAAQAAAERRSAS